MKQANHRRRHILVAVAGQTPQIITETLYALMVQRRPPIPISEIFIITTAKGATTARRLLLDPPHGQFFAFCRDYGFDPNSIAFDEDHIITIKKEVVSDQWSVVSGQRLTTTGHGQPTENKGQRTNDKGPMTDLEDIRTIEDNAALGQQTFGFIKQLTADPQTALHCSIAGGRKTMSVYLALALMVYGREQDTLSHVLVSEEFESNPKFFFPPKRNQAIAIRRGNEWEVGQTKDARIEPAEIPFVRLRQALGEGFATVEQTVDETIRTVQHELSLRRPPEDRLIVDLRQRVISYGSTTFRLPPVHLALYAYFAQIRKENVAPDQELAPTSPTGFLILKKVDLNRFAQIYQRLFPHTPDQSQLWLSKIRNRPKDAPPWHSYLLGYVNRINKVIREHNLTPQLEITAARRYAETTYGIPLSPSLIDVIE